MFARNRVASDVLWQNWFRLSKCQFRENNVCKPASFMLQCALYIHLCTFIRCSSIFWNFCMHSKLEKIRLDHNSYISLHVQLHNQLRRLIVSGCWQYGERIPTEAQLSRHLDISRTTVRIALQRIEVEGLIKRNAGRGTFVTWKPQNHPPPSAVPLVILPAASITKSTASCSTAPKLNCAPPGTKSSLAMPPTMTKRRGFCNSCWMTMLLD